MSRHLKDVSTLNKETIQQQMEDCNKLLSDIHIPRFFSSIDTPFLEKKVFNLGNQTVGLQNLGSTCWFNVVIQLLYHIPCFRQRIIELTSHQDFAFNQHPAVLGLQELFISIMFSERKLINPSSALQSIGKILGNAEGQQDASEFLGLVLDRLQRATLHSAVDKLFSGSFIYMNDTEQGRLEDFMQYVLQVDEVSSLNSLIESNIGVNYDSYGCSPTVVAEKLIFKIPAILCIDLCRMAINSETSLPIKKNYKVIFQPLIFMDGYIHENLQEISLFRENSNNIAVCRQVKLEKLQSLQSFLENIIHLPGLLKAYEQTVQQSSIDFELLTRLNSSWETEIQVKMNELYSELRQLEDQESIMKNEGLSKLHPYRLHAVIVHQGESNQGHYWIFVWNSVEKCWYHIDDTFTQRVAWEDVSEVAFGGLENDSSAQCLVYVDALKVNDLLDLKQDYQISYTDSLTYLKDHTDARTRNIAFAKNQSRQAIIDVCRLNSASNCGSRLLFNAMDKERKRLFELARKWKMEHFGEEVRLIHIGVYLIINKVEYEPYILWSLLQHFACYALLTDEKISPACNAARHALVFLENSTTNQEKETFMKWNSAYYKFRVTLRYLMHAINHITGSKVNATVAFPAAVKALCTHFFLKEINLGPAMSINPTVAHLVIERSAKLLSNQLLEADLLTVDEIAFATLIDGLKGWCTYSLGELAKSILINEILPAYTEQSLLKASRDTTREILLKWFEVVNVITSKSLEKVEENLEITETLQKIRAKLENLQLFIGSNNATDPATQIEYKGHLLSTHGEEEYLYNRWKELWALFQTQSFSNLK